MPQVKQEKERAIIRQQILKRIESLGFNVAPKPDWGEHHFLLNDEIGISLDYVHLNYKREYVFKFNKDNYDFFYNHHRHFFQLFICESTERVFIVPLSLIMEIFNDIFATGSDFKEFKPNIKLRNGVWFLRFFGQYDITDYLNRYDFLITESKTLPSKPTRFNSVKIAS